VSREDVISQIDCYAWLSVNTCGPTFSHEKLKNYLIDLSVWCVSPNGPRLVSDDYVAQEIKELFTRKWYRPADGISFRGYWNMYGKSFQANKVFETQIPFWTHLYKESCVRVWPQVWNSLVEALVPEEFRMGFRDSLDPEMAILMRDFLRKPIDSKVKTDISMMFDFLEWSLVSGMFHKIPAWVYLYFSLFKRQAPMYVSCEIDQSNRPLITSWVKAMRTSSLLNWSLGIRAMQLLNGNTFYLPVEIARMVLLEITQRPNKDFAMNWLSRRGAILTQ
jgi:hypothetical protein